jgi:hypothetical protein
MKTKLMTALSSLVVLAALVASFTRPMDGGLTPMTSVAGDDFARRPVVRQLPSGFTLPPTDVNLSVSSLVTADLDADGDLDIVAADRSNGTVGIVVWVNDGAGHLTRKEPARSTSLAGEPALPSIERREATTAASIQSNGPVVEAIAVDPRLTPPVQPYEQPPSVTPPSPPSSALRSRSPPVRS